MRLRIWNAGNRGIDVANVGIGSVGVSIGHAGDCGDGGDHDGEIDVTDDKGSVVKGGADEGGLDRGERCRFRSNATSLSLTSSTSQRCFRVFSCWLAEDGEGAGDGDGEGGEGIVLVVVADVVL